MEIVSNSWGHAANGTACFFKHGMEGVGYPSFRQTQPANPGFGTIFTWVYLHVFLTSIGGNICFLSNIKHISAGLPHPSINGLV